MDKVFGLMLLEIVNIKNNLRCKFILRMIYTNDIKKSICSYENITKFACKTKLYNFNILLGVFIKQMTKKYFDDILILNSSWFK